MTSPKPASETIIKQQQQVLHSLPFYNTADFDDASRGLKRSPGRNVVHNQNHDVVWDNEQYKFLTGDAPNEANPSLWRQSKLTAADGLYEVVPEAIYQVRGLDLSNTTFVEGKDAIIVIDPLTSRETGEAALKLYREYRRHGKPIGAIIYTHSHADHFGGVKGMVSQDDVDQGRVQILAPEGFLEHAVAENVYTGTAMSRRAAYMYGAALSRSPRGQIGAGLGQTVSTGEVTLIAPTDTITKTKETRCLFGVNMEFQMAPDTEAPSEMLIYFPDHKALCAAEDATHTFHNILTLRGAVVRDPHAWSRYLTETIDLFAPRTDVVFASHHWPTWGADRVREFLTLQRDLYAYVHDQTLRLLNRGFTGPEIAEQLVLPPALEQAWCSRGYYGSVSHNVKAVYQRYMGWFDGNPAHLWEHVPTERAKRYVELAGGAGPLLDKAQKAFDGGDYRWAAEILNHAVFANPRDDKAKGLLADTYEQMGYGAENGTWRNFFISGATELRSGNFGTPTATASRDVVGQLAPEMLFDSLAAQINGPEAWGVNVAIDVVVEDRGVTYRLWLSNGALVYSKEAQAGDAEVVVRGTARELTAFAVHGLDADKLREAGVEVEGDEGALGRLAGVLQKGDPGFDIVLP